MNKDELLKDYQEIFGEAGKDVFFSPGRINVIGEHTDYNGGHVFPAAISLGVYGVYGPRTDNKVRLYSGNVDGDIVEFDLNDDSVEKDDRFWANYFKGMITYLRQREDGEKINHGFNLYVKANLPSGSGLSSSAAIEMLMGIILKDEFDLDVDRPSLARLGQKTENEFVGLNSGIMDQFACIMGKKDSAIFLDCNFTIFGDDYDTKDGTNVRDYVQVEDLIDAHILALKHVMETNKSDVFSLGTAQGYSNLEILEAAKKVTGIDIPYTIGPRRGGDPDSLVADSSKARKVLGWKPKHENVDDVIATAWNWHKSHPKGYEDK